MMQPVRWFSLCLITLLLSLSSLPSLGKEAPGSMESLWTTSDGQDSGQATTVPSAPLCPLQAFRSSALVIKGPWPGIGPFTADEHDPLTLIDAQQNQVKVKTSDDKITQAEVTLLKEKKSAPDFLDLQMTADFLLEAVGARPKKIVDFNEQFEKSKEVGLFKSRGRPATVTAGRLLVFLSRQNYPGQDQSKFVIKVMSRDASRETLGAHSAQVKKNAQDIHETTTTAPAQPVETQAISSKGSATQADVLKKEFADVITNWQNIKKTAIREHQIASLDQVLSGKALTRQINAIKWLITNKKHYDMNPKGVVVDHFDCLEPEGKYAVYAQVRESSKFIDEPSGQVLKAVDDTYNVNYTLQKISDHWFITDSALVLPSSNQQATGEKKAKVVR